MINYEVEQKKRFPIVCPHCEKELYSQRSLGMLLGFTDVGFGKCPKCEMYMELKYDPVELSLQAKNGEHAKTINAAAQRSEASA